MPTKPAEPKAKRDPLKDTVAALRHASSTAEARSLEEHAETLRQRHLAPDVLLLLKHANAALEKHDFQTAARDLGDALTLQSDQPILRRQRAQVRYAAGDFEGAISDLAVALQGDPDDVKAWQMLSAIEHERHDYKAAVTAFDHVLTLDPKVANGAGQKRRLETERDGQPT
ncbi:hypothetical protein NCH01_01800 [Neoasaia chiangmaiensis]|nr:hypothetical protein NCH01_01800 [Neoasaia chiangmaiensis]